MVVVMAMRGITNPTVATMSYNGRALALIRHVNNGDVAIEYWYQIAPDTGGAFNLNFDLGAVVTSFTQEILGVNGFGVLGTGADASGAGAGAPLVSLAPTLLGGAVLDCVNMTNLVGYVPNPGQGFLDFGFVGLTTGLYEITTKTSDPGSTSMGGTVAAGAGAWIYSAIELSVGPIQTPQIAAAIRTKPHRTSGVGVLGTAEIGLPTELQEFIALSNPLLVVGFNSFQVIMQATNNCNVWFVQCDPTSFQALTIELVDGYPSPGLELMTFGAFSSSPGIPGSGEDWNVVRVGLNAIAGTTLTSFRLFLGRR
jgi:hypothetical protein